MPTWSETQTYLRGRFRLRTDEPERIELGWTFPGSLDVQLQVVELRHAMKRPLLVIKCVAGTGLDEREALEHNMTLGVGGLALADGEYVLRHAVFLDDLAWPTLDLALEMVAHEAARLKQRRRGVADLSAFLNFAE